jgi:hypothetical protein
LPSEEEWKQLTVALEARRGKPRSDELSYEEFVAALSPFCKPAGKFPERSLSPVGIERTTYSSVLALDMSKIEGSRSSEKSRPAPRPAAPAEPVERVAERPCPSCGESIDVRAVFCRHCRQTVAQHVTCSHCGETRVPDDLEHCWKCGTRMRAAEKIDCPQCFSFHGYEAEFPCPICGYNLNGTSPKPEETAPPPVSSLSGLGKTVQPEEQIAAPPPAQLIECPTCYSMVEPGPRCSVCQGLLGMS